MSNFGDYGLDIFKQGLDGHLPKYPFSFEELREGAKGVLSHSIFTYTDGGCGNDATQKANVDAFARYGITPRMLRASPSRDISVEYLGRKFPTPIFMSPIGVTGVLDRDHDGEMEAGRAAANMGVPLCVSTLSERPMEEIAKSFGDTPGFFQLYTPNDRELAESFISRAEKSGYQALMVTLDTWTPGWRPRDLTFANFPQLRGWCLSNYFTDPRFKEMLGKEPSENVRDACQLFAKVFGQPLTWGDLKWLREVTKIPLFMKGICHPDDARRALDEGVDGIYCSNHGGRQANGGRAALDMLPEVVKAAGDAPVLFDSGVRTGTDIVKALAMGATAVGVGRPYAFGLAMGGQKGVEHVLKCLLAEADLYMAIDGYPKRSDLTPDILHRV